MHYIIKLISHYDLFFNFYAFWYCISLNREEMLHCLLENSTWTRILELQFSLINQWKLLNKINLFSAVKMWIWSSVAMRIKRKLSNDEIKRYNSSSYKKLFKVPTTTTKKLGCFFSLRCPNTEICHAFTCSFSNHCTKNEVFH